MMMIIIIIIIIMKSNVLAVPATDSYIPMDKEHD